MWIPVCKPAVHGPMQHVTSITPALTTASLNSGEPTLEDSERNALDTADHQRRAQHLNLVVRLDQPLVVPLKLKLKLLGVPKSVPILPLLVLQNDLASPFTELLQEEFDLEYQHTDADKGGQQVEHLLVGVCVCV